MSAIIFDFDGTIADSFEVVLELFYELTGHPVFAPEEIVRLRRTASVRKVAKTVGITPRQVPRILIKGRGLMAARLGEVRPFVGIEAVLATLHESGYQLFVMSSNSRPNVEAFLKAHNLWTYFDGVYGGAGLLSKAAALGKVMRQNKLDSADCFYVGDEVRDILAAKKAHVRPVAVTWGYNDASILESEKPFAVVRSPQDLPKVFVQS